MEALQAARGDAGAKGDRPAVQKAAGDARQTTEFAGDNRARLSIYTTFGGPRLVWRVLADKSSTQLYDYVIDARTGEVLRRDNTVEFATGLAWDYFPGPLPLNSSGTATSRNFTANGWLGSTATTLSGNNAHTYFDFLDDNTPAAGDEIGAELGHRVELPAHPLQRRQLLPELLDRSSRARGTRSPPTAGGRTPSRTRPRSSTSSTTSTTG